MHKNKIIWGEVTEEYQSFTIQGVPFRLVTKNFSKHFTNDKFIVILKNKMFIDTEILYFDYAKPKNMVELGLYEGGSAIFWHLLYGLKFIGFDLRKQPDSIVKWIKQLGIEDSVSLEYETSQDDEPKIKAAIRNFLGNDPIDLIIDDASHQYPYSRRSFEITYPMLRAGGIYCIEDWSWAHVNSAQWQVEKQWQQIPALTNLLFDITMLLGSKTEWFQQVTLRSFAAFVFSSGNAPKEGFSFDKYILKQDRRFTPL
jgi:hypothetical protein